MNAGMLSKCVAFVNFRLSVDSQTHVYPWDPDEHCIFLYGIKKTVKTINFFFFFKKINFGPEIIP